MKMIVGGSGQSPINECKSAYRALLVSIWRELLIVNRLNKEIRQLIDFQGILIIRMCAL